MLIKICGVTDLKTVKACAKSGVDMVGFVFSEKSTRSISVQEATPLIQTCIDLNMEPVGIFVDSSAEEIEEICKKTGLQRVQLHGKKAKAAEKDLPKSLGRIYAIAVGENGEILEEIPNLDPQRDILHFDAKDPGKGNSFNHEKFSPPQSMKFFISGGLHPQNVRGVIQRFQPFGVDVSSGVEKSLRVKCADLIEQFVQQASLGGTYLPEILIQPVAELAEAFAKCKKDAQFQKEFRQILKDYAGRETPLTEIRRFSDAINGPRIFLKREDLLHTGAHKLNNALGQCLLAKRMGKTRIIAETGAGQHGLATATACAHLGLACEIYMGKVDIKRQSPNVEKMRLLGAKVLPVLSGSQTLKDAVNEALRDYAENFETTHYCIGSVLGPHPYPEMVAYFQSIIGEEAKRQIQDVLGKDPDLVVACVGGGSNAIGLFSAFLESNARLIGVEAGGKSLKLGEHAARFSKGRMGVLHGCKTYVLQDNEGQIAQTHSISAGLDYPAIGPQHVSLFIAKRAKYVSATDAEALQAFKLLARVEGIIPALESAHALAFVIREAKNLQNQTVLINLSGRGDKDLPQLREIL